MPVACSAPPAVVSSRSNRSLRASGDSASGHRANTWIWERRGQRRVWGSGTGGAMTSGPGSVACDQSSVGVIGKDRRFVGGVLLYPRLSTKKSLFPVQRVAVFFFFFFCLAGNYCPFKKKKKAFFKNEKKKVLSRPFFLDTRPLHRKHFFFFNWPQQTQSVAWSYNPPPSSHFHTSCSIALYSF